MSRRLSPRGRSGRSASFGERWNPRGTKARGCKYIYSLYIYLITYLHPVKITAGELIIYFFVFTRDMSGTPERSPSNPCGTKAAAFRGTLAVPVGMPLMLR